MIKHVSQALGLCLVASFLSSCALAQIPVRMLQAVGRTVNMVGDSSPIPPSSPLLQREIEDSRVPLEVKPAPALPTDVPRLAEGSDARDSGPDRS
jgi:hypothetical protein